VGGKSAEGPATLSRVDPDSPAEKAGMKPGDVILKVDTVTITNFDSFSAEVQKCQPGAKVDVEVKRGDETVILRLRIGRKDN
jgi:S1-C subfamily serine protease